MKNIKHIRIILLILAAAVVLIPTMIVGITGNGLGAVVSHSLISLSIGLVIAATLLGLDSKRKDKFFTKIGISIGLVIVLISLWL